MSGTLIGSSTNSASPISRTPAAGNDLILLLQTNGGSPVLNKVQDSTSATVLTDFAFTPSGSIGIGVYRVHGASAVAHSLSVLWTTAPTQFSLTLMEVAGIAALDSTAGTLSIASGTSASPTSSGVAPSKSGDFLLALTSINHFVNSFAWNGGLTAIHTFINGPTYSSAYLASASSGSQSVNATIDLSEFWGVLLLAYTPSAINTLVVPPQGGGSMAGNSPSAIPAANSVIFPSVARRRDFESRPSGLLMPRERKVFLSARRAA